MASPMHENLRLPCRDNYPYLKNVMKTKWKQESTATGDYKLREIKSSVQEWPISRNKSRNTAVMVMNFNESYLI